MSSLGSVVHPNYKKLFLIYAWWYLVMQIAFYKAFETSEPRLLLITNVTAFK